MHLLAVIGNPIAHSLSPQIHHAFANQFNLALRYEKILAPLDQFENTAMNFITHGGMGFNVTVPFKVNAFDWVEMRSNRALQAGAVNTVKVSDGVLFGDNTDGVGLLNDLHSKNVALKNQQIIIIGAGGATRGILPALINELPEKIVIINRDITKAKKLLITHQASEIEFGDFSLLADNKLVNASSLIIDATSHFEAVQQTLMRQSLSKHLVVYDLKYSRHATTPLVQWANAQGLKAYDGLGMLIEQAAEAFHVWFGVRPNTTSLSLNI